MTACKICGAPMAFAFAARVLGKYEARYYSCETCGFLSAREPHWLSEAYSRAIASTDTGMVARNIATARKLAAVLYFLRGERGAGRYVDVAGGYGLLTRLMRDYGFDFYWSDKYCENLAACGFEYTPARGPCSAVTAFEVLEHTEDPVDFVREAMKCAQAKAFICTTELFEGGPPPPGQWMYYSFGTGQHISFFQRRTLDALAGKLGLTVSSTGWLHILAKDRVGEIGLRLCAGRLNALAVRWLRKNLATRITSDHDMLLAGVK